MKTFCPALLVIAIAALLSGCQSVPANKPAVTYVPPPTTLVIAVDNADMTEAEYQARRDELIKYLIVRGYIQSEADLVANDAGAQRMIRATLAADGGFKISVYSLDAEDAADMAVAVVAPIPPSYYDDYYYYGFGPVPLYGYASWPIYSYPIYPAYPLCPPARPVAPYCPPSIWHRPTYTYCPPPHPQYVNCGYIAQPHNQWPDRQVWSNWSHNVYRGPSNIAHSRPYNSTVNYAAYSAPNTNFGRNERIRPPSARPREATNALAATNLASTPTTPDTPRRFPRTAETQTYDGSTRNYHNPRTRNNEGRATVPETAQTSTTGSTANPATLPPRVRTADNDARPQNNYPRAHSPERRYTPPSGTTPDSRPRVATQPNSNSPRPANVANDSVRPSPDGRQRTTTPSGSSSPRPASVANGGTRSIPTPAPSQRPQSTPANNSTPRTYSAPAPARSAPSSSSSSATRQTASSSHEGSTSRNSNEH